MSRQNNGTVQIGPRIDRRVWEQFKEFVEQKHGKTSGVTADEVEKALQQRMGEDPLQHVDDRLRRIEDELGIDRPTQSDGPVGERETVSNADRDPTTDDLTPRTQNRVDKILGQLPGRFTEDQLEAAIENVAGSSYKTLQRYKEILTNRHMVVRAPWVDEQDEGDGFYQDRRMFAIAATSNMDAGALYQLQDTLAVHWGEDWVNQELPDDMPNPFDTGVGPDGSDVPSVPESRHCPPAGAGRDGRLTRPQRVRQQHATLHRQPCDYQHATALSSVTAA